MIDNDTKIVWDKIVSELATLQDEKENSYSRPVFNHYSDEQVGNFGYESKPNDGFVINSICGYPLLFDTACAANVFATEYQRTSNSEWLERSKKAIQVIESFSPHSGLHELKWDPLGWYFDNLSLFSTTVVLDGYWEAKMKLGLPMNSNNNKSSWKELGVFLEQCRSGTGKYAHYVFNKEANPSDVQNTTAMSIFLRVFATKHYSKFESLLGDTLNDSLGHMASGQRTDGFWPYRYPDRFQMLVHSKFPQMRQLLDHPISRYLSPGGAIMHGDSAHQCYILYYLSKAAQYRDTFPQEIVEQGWNWLKQHISHNSDGIIVFNFSWEPEPKSRIKFTNKYDTNTYFWIISILPYIHKLNIISRSKIDEIRNGFCKHILQSLVVDGSTPIIKRHECSYRLQKKILPAIWQSVGLKGHLMANSITNSINYNN